MVKLKEQVIDALIQKDALEYLEMLQNPEYLEKLKQMFQEMSASAVEILDDGITDEDEKEELTNLIYKDMAGPFCDPNQLEQIASQAVIENYKTNDDLVKEYDHMFKNKDFEQRVGQEGIKKLKEAFQILIEKSIPFSDFKEKVIEKTLKIAKKEGLEKAVNKESQNKIIQELLPNSEKYIEFFMSSFKISKEFLSNFQDIISKGEEADQIHAALMNAMQNSLQKISHDFTKARADKIYGK